MFCRRSQHQLRRGLRNAGRGSHIACRSFSTAFDSVKPETVEVEVGSNGPVSLDIYHPPRPAQIHPVILYLSHGPISFGPLESVTEPHDIETASVLPSLATAANATVVRVHYRLDAKHHRWPTPLHDSLAAYDWAAKHLASSRAGHATIGVCGEFIGGGLAAAIALTEGRKLTENGTHVRAAVLGNPITDWTAMYNVPKPKALAGVPEAPKRKRGRKTKKGPSWDEYAFSEALSADALLLARNSLFASPQHCFDPFASPMLFFRASGIEVPTSVRSIDPFEEWLAEIDGRAPKSALAAVEKRRRSHRRYPPADSDLILPHTRLWVGEESVLKDQGIELAKSIDRNVGVQKTGGISEERAAVHVAPGLGLWGSSELAQIGGWFGNILWHQQAS